MSRTWKVKCWPKASGAAGGVGGEFSTMCDALDFAESRMQPGWAGTLINPSGQQVDLELGKVPRFPPQPKG